MDEKDNREFQYNRNGGLTLIPMPGFEILASRVQDLIKSKRSELVDISFPKIERRINGEPCFKLGKEHIGGHDCMLITSGPGTEEMIAQTQYALGYLVGRRAQRITLVTGYMPLCRSDKDEGEDELALLNFIIHLFLSASYGKLDRIITVDIHSPQGVLASQPMGLITEVSLVREVLKKAVGDAMLISPGSNICIVLTDEGSVKRFEAAIKKVEEEMNIKFGIISGVKRRESSKKSKFLGLQGDVDMLNGTIVIMLDDELAGGGTCLDEANFILSNHSVKLLWAVVVHGVICGQAPKMLGLPTCPIERLYISDTIPFHNRPEVLGLIKKGKIFPVSWEEELALVIFYHHWDKSIRGMR